MDRLDAEGKLDVVGRGLTSVDQSLTRSCVIEITDNEFGDEDVVINEDACNIWVVTGLIKSLTAR